MSPRNTCLALSLWAALGVVAAAHASQVLEPNPQAVPDVSASERSSGSNAKLDVRLIRLKKQRRSSGPSFSARSIGMSPSIQAGSAVAAAGDQYVDIDVVAKGDPATLRKQLEALGFKTRGVFRNNLGGSLPVSKIDAAAALDGVIRISAPEAQTNSGEVSSQGDSSQRSKLLRDTQARIDGTGLTIGVISDSFDCASQKNRNNARNARWVRLRTMQDDINSDDLPAAPNVVNESHNCADWGSDEGRAMAQIIHDVAPGARIAFYSASGEAEFAQAVQTLALPVGQQDALGHHGAGAQIIVDDISFFGEPLFQEGIAGEAIDDAVENRGVAYFSAAGNMANAGRAAYDNGRAVFAAAPVARARWGAQPLNVGERLLNFDASGVSTVTNIPITIKGVPQGNTNTVQISAYWDQPMTGQGSANSLNLCIGDRNGNPLQGVACSGPSGIGQPAHTMAGVSYGAAQDLQLTLRLGLVDGAAPGRVHLIIKRGSASFDRFGTDGGTIYGHPLADKAVAVGAADYFNTPYCQPALRTATLESYSSQGGTPFLFNADGTPIARVRTPAKPEIVAPDGGSTTFFGMNSLNNAGLHAAVADCSHDLAHQSFNFYGTSAAAPHAAAVAALLRQASPAAAADDVYDALKNSALDMDDPGTDYKSGHGFIQADQALNALRNAL